MLTLCFASLILFSPGYPGAESTADYNIEVSLDPDSTRIQGTMEMVFTSGVDFPVDTLWLHLYPTPTETALPLSPGTLKAREISASDALMFQREAG
ncbi:hypothetical protein DRQ21_07020 [Candidatus Fermentibacteria bacterium]|nr:MAG: hypothetical protein DRQ21_07020 [Candidatus Fermentibacteria bacterium]